MSCWSIVDIKIGKIMFIQNRDHVWRKNVTTILCIGDFIRHRQIVEFRVNRTSKMFFKKMQIFRYPNIWSNIFTSNILKHWFYDWKIMKCIDIVIDAYAKIGHACEIMIHSCEVCFYLEWKKLKYNFYFSFVENTLY